MRTTDLKSKAILVDFDGSYYNWTRRDTRIEKAVAESNSVSSSAGKYLKNLFLSCDAPLAAIRQTVQTARQDHERMTIPWEPQKRLLLNQNFLLYTQKQNQHHNSLDVAKETLRDSYQDLIVKAKSALGVLFRAEDYPEIDEILQACAISHKFYGLSDSSDVRLEVGEETLAEIKAEVEKTQTEQYSSAVNHVWERFSDILENAVQNLAKVGGTSARFRSEWHAHLSEFLSLLGGLNLSQDPKLDSLAQASQVLLSQKAEDYEVSKEIRAEGFTLAQKILDDLKSSYQKKEDK
jgi:hypothetical protein